MEQWVSQIFIENSILFILISLVYVLYRLNPKRFSQTVFLGVAWFNRGLLADKAFSATIKAVMRTDEWATTTMKDMERQVLRKQRSWEQANSLFQAASEASLPPQRVMVMLVHNGEYTTNQRGLYKVTCIAEINGYNKLRLMPFFNAVMLENLCVRLSEVVHFGSPALVHYDRQHAHNDVYVDTHTHMHDLYLQKGVIAEVVAPIMTSQSLLAGIMVLHFDETLTPEQAQSLFEPIDSAVSELGAVL